MLIFRGESFFYCQLPVRQTIPNCEYIWEYWRRKKNIQSLKLKIHQIQANLSLIIFLPRLITIMFMAFVCEILRHIGNH